jgi:hypothetical protein
MGITCGFGRFDRAKTAGFSCAAAVGLGSAVVPSTAAAAQTPGARRALRRILDPQHDLTEGNARSSASARRRRCTTARPNSVRASGPAGRK